MVVDSRAKSKIAAMGILRRTAVAASKSHAGGNKPPAEKEVGPFVPDDRTENGGVAAGGSRGLAVRSGGRPRVASACSGCGVWVAPFPPVPGTLSAQGLQGGANLGYEGVVGAVGLGQDLGRAFETGSGGRSVAQRLGEMG